MKKFKASVILMGIDWSKVAKTIALSEMRGESPEICDIINDLDDYYRRSHGYKRIFH